MWWAARAVTVPVRGRLDEAASALGCSLRSKPGAGLSSSHTSLPPFRSIRPWSRPLRRDRAGCRRAACWQAVLPGTWRPLSRPSAKRRQESMSLQSGSACISGCTTAGSLRLSVSTETLLNGELCLAQQQRRRTKVLPPALWQRWQARGTLARAARTRVQESVGLWDSSRAALGLRHGTARLRSAS